MKQTMQLSNKTKTELTAMARRKKIPVTPGMVKDELIKTIKKGLRKIEAQKKSKPAKQTSKKKDAKKTEAKTVSRKTAAGKGKHPTLGGGIGELHGTSPVHQGTHINDLTVLLFHHNF